MSYQDHISQVGSLIEAKAGARMRLQNRFQTGLDIARYTAAIMRKDMAAYDADPSQYTQSLGCWHGFIGQQKMISIKKHFNTTDRPLPVPVRLDDRRAALGIRPLPDQSMHEKTAVAALIKELYTFLRQADARELGGCSASWTPRRRPATAAEPSRTRSRATSPTSCRSSPTSTPASAMPRRPTCWPSR
jgi:isocitrate lyase